MSDLTCLEICAGAGGQSRGLELAGFGHAVALELDPDATETLRQNRPEWHVTRHSPWRAASSVLPTNGIYSQRHSGSCGKPAQRLSCWRTSKGSLSANSPTTARA